MSRIGRVPITIPPRVEVRIDEENHVEVQGPKGTLHRTLHPRVIVQRHGDTIEVLRQSDAKLDKSLHGLSRTLIHNMIVGVTTGFEKQLEIVWGGHRAQLQNDTLTLQLGHSHPIAIEAPRGVEFELNRTLITVRGINKELVGQVAANIRAIRKPEPYKGKGIKYTTETIRRKVGKTG
ncbi:50S ribosomal protein L6 [Candidatus Entotheonellaceae bacterium PAL068K]